MATTIDLHPRPPYDLARSARFQGCGTRRVRDGVLQMAFHVAGAPARAAVRQRRDGTLEAQVEAADLPAAADALRFALAVDLDLAPFLARAARDELLGPLLPALEGYVPLRLSTVAHAALRGMCGQLIRSDEARKLEWRIVRRAMPTAPDGFRLPPRTADLAALSPSDLERCGLAGRRAAALVRLCRTLELERLREHPTPAVVARLVREPQLGPWTAGVVCLEGLGRLDHGLVGDLGLIRLASRVLGRPATPEDTAELIAPWEEWAGLASVYLLAHPLASTDPGLGFDRLARRRPARRRQAAIVPAPTIASPS